MDPAPRGPECCQLSALGATSWTPGTGHPDLRGHQPGPAGGDLEGAARVGRPGHRPLPVGAKIATTSLVRAYSAGSFADGDHPRAAATGPGGAGLHPGDATGRTTGVGQSAWVTPVLRWADFDGGRLIDDVCLAIVRHGSPGGRVTPHVPGRPDDEERHADGDAGQGDRGDARRAAPIPGRLRLLDPGGHCHRRWGW